jgi:hypothetical protein
MCGGPGTYCAIYTSKEDAEDAFLMRKTEAEQILL